MKIFSHKPSRHYQLLQNACKALLLVLLLGGSLPVVGQSVGINDSNSSADNSAVLDVQSTSKGMLIPRMLTTQRTGISAPATGLLVFDTTTNSFWFYTGTAWTELVSGTVSQIADADNNTKVQTEKNANEDVVRVDIAGTEHLKITSGGHLQTMNTGQSVFLGENAGAADDLTNNANVAVGYNALQTNTTGSDNIALGRQAMTGSTGSNSIGIGYNALVANTSGNTNAALGYNILTSNTTGSGNVAVGSGLLTSNTTGTRNIALVQNALSGNQTGGNNIALGYFALATCNASDNIALGFACMNSTTTGTYSVGLGSQALYSNTTGSRNLAFGFGALQNNTTASDNVALGHRGLLASSTGARNIAIGSNVLDGNTTANDNIGIGYNALTNLVTSGENVALVRRHWRPTRPQII